jgi:hypothetical protein
VDVAQGQGHALARRQRGERLGQRGPRSKDEVVVEALDGRPPLTGQRQRHLDPGAPATERPQCVPDRDLAHPRVEGVGLAQAMQRAQHVQRHVLGDVRRLVAAAHDRRRGAQGHGHRPAHRGFSLALGHVRVQVAPGRRLLASSVTKAAA